MLTFLFTMTSVPIESVAWRITPMVSCSLCRIVMTEARSEVLLEHLKPALGVRLHRSLDRSVVLDATGDDSLGELQCRRLLVCRGVAADGDLEQARALGRGDARGRSGLGWCASGW